MTVFSKAELDDIWENKPHGHFTKLVKSVKGKKKYKIKTVAYRTTEEVLGEEETVVLAKTRDDAIGRLNQERCVTALRHKLKLQLWDHSVRYKTMILGEVT